MDPSDFFTYVDCKATVSVLEQVHKTVRLLVRNKVESATDAIVDDCFMLLYSDISDFYRKRDENTP